MDEITVTLTQNELFDVRQATYKESTRFFEGSKWHFLMEKLNKFYDAAVNQNKETKASRIYKSVTYTTSFDVENVLIKGGLPAPWTVRIDYNVCLDDNERYFVVNLERKSEGFATFFKSVVYQSFENIDYLEHQILIGQYYTLKGIAWSSAHLSPCAGNLAAPDGSDCQFTLSDATSTLLKRKYFELKGIADDEVRRHVHG